MHTLSRQVCCLMALVLLLALTPAYAEGSDYEFDAASGTITKYLGSAEFLEVPSAIAGTAVRHLAQDAFKLNKSIKELVLPEGLLTIGKDAFFSTGVTGIRFPDSLTSIGERAFYGIQVSELSLPDSLRELGKEAFALSQITEVRLPEGMELVPEKAFERCWNLETIYLPASLRKIDSKAFIDCDRVTYIVFAGDTPPEMADDAFLECDKMVDVDIAHDASAGQAKVFEDALMNTGLQEGGFKVWRANHPDAPPFPKDLAMQFDEATQLVSGYSDNVEALSMYFNFWKADGSGTLDIVGVADGVFEGSGLKEFYTPRTGSFVTIGNRAFKDSALTRIDLFDSVQTIGAEAFAGCEELTDIVLPASVVSIGDGAFAGCGSLRSVTFLGESPTLGSEVFAGCENLETLTLPGGVVLGGDPGIPMERIRARADASPEQLAALGAALNLPWYWDLPMEGEEPNFQKMPGTFEENAESEFEFDQEAGSILRYLGQAPRVVVPRSIGGVAVREIGFSAFSNLTVLSVLEGSQDNQVLEEVILPETVRVIKDSAFLNCTELRRVEVYGPIDLLGVRAFENCTSLEEVIFHNGILEMGVYAFNLCENLGRVELGSKLAALPEGAFFGCGFEGTLVMEVPAIGALAYKNNKRVTELHIPEYVKDIGEGAFQGMPELKAIWFEQPDPAFLGEYRFQFDESAAGAMVYVPTSSTEEQVALYKTKMNQNLLPGDSMVTVRDCVMEHVTASPAADVRAGETAEEFLPELSEVESEQQQEPAVETIATVDAEEPAFETQAPEPAPADEGQPQMGRRYVCVSADSGGVPFNITLIGVYAVVFHEDGTADLTIGGIDAPELPYQTEDSQILVDYYGQQLRFVPEGQGYSLDFMGAMTLGFIPE